MPLGIVSDEEFEKEIRVPRSDNIPTHTIIPMNTIIPTNTIIKEIERGRGNKEEVPEVIRKVIGEEKILGTSNKELSEIFKVSESSVSAYGNGANSTSSYKSGNSELRNHLNGVRDKIVKRASKKLNIALTSLTESDIQDSKPIEKAQIARIMSGVIKDMMPEEQVDRNNNIQFVFFAPKMRDENTYDTIDVSGME